MMTTPTERIREKLSESKAYGLARPVITIKKLVEFKRKGIKVRKIAFGITPELRGRIYDVGGYRFILKETPEEIERALKEVK
jgi:hypothetical protein